MFKFALDAGHALNTVGKRCLRKLDPNETREWTLNDRIADKVEKLLQDYTGYELLRVDDTTGKKDVSLSSRVKAANNFKADFYLSIHHNAGIKGGNGGGIVVYTCKNAQAASVEWQKALYKALIDATWLKGNRSNPTPQSNFTVISKTTMPAVLMELGFMDSSTDVPIILTENYADLCAEAIVKVLVEKGKLTRKASDNETTTDTDKVCDVNISVLCKGIKGSTVTALQILLEGYGYTMKNNGKTYKVDGSFGGATENAVKAFQADRNIKPTGVCDLETWNALLGI